MKVKFLLHKRNFIGGKEAIGNYAEVLSSTMVRHFAPNERHGLAFIVEANVPNGNQAIQKIMEIFNEKKIVPIRVFRNYCLADTYDLIPCYWELELPKFGKKTAL